MDVFSWFLCSWDITRVSKLLEQQGDMYSLSHEENTNAAVSSTERHHVVILGNSYQ